MILYPRKIPQLLSQLTRNPCHPVAIYGDVGAGKATFLLSICEQKGWQLYSFPMDFAWNDTNVLDHVYYSLGQPLNQSEKRVYLIRDIDSITKALSSPRRTLTKITQMINNQNSILFLTGKRKVQLINCIHFWLGPPDHHRLTELLTMVAPSEYNVPMCIELGNNDVRQMVLCASMGTYPDTDIDDVFAISKYIQCQTRDRLIHDSSFIATHRPIVTSIMNHYILQEATQLENLLSLCEAQSLLDAIPKNDVHNFLWLETYNSIIQTEKIANQIHPQYRVHLPMDPTKCHSTKRNIHQPQTLIDQLNATT